MPSSPESGQEPEQTPIRSFSQDANTNLRSPKSPKSPTTQTQQIPRDRSTLTRWWAVANIISPGARREQATKDTSRLTFFQRHFTKPVATDPEKPNDPRDRRFAIASHGFIIAALGMLLILFAIIGAALGTTLGHHHRRPNVTPEGTQDPNSGSQEGSPSHPSPIRTALLDNFPDPALVYANNTWYAFATNNAAGILQRPDNASSAEYGTSNIQVATSPDFLNWTLHPSKDDPLPKVGMWAAQGSNPHTNPPIPHANVWAPSVIRRPEDDRWILYYTAARNKLDSTFAAAANATGADEPFFIPAHPPPHCIGASLSLTSSPLGPYEPVNSTFACQIERGGAIDPAAFRDADDSLYVLYKIDGNNIGHGGTCGNTNAPIVPTPIMLQRMQPGGLEPDGEAVQLLDRQKGDGPLIEAPELVRSDEGVYFLFFSSGCTRAASYDLKYATATNVAGPYRRAKGTLLATGDWGLLAPGSVGVARGEDGEWRMAFHARTDVPEGKVRAMYTTRLQLSGNRATLVRDDDEESA